MLSLTNCEWNLPLKSKISGRCYINIIIFCLNIIHSRVFIFLKLLNEQKEDAE
jgi:hypothetical protein